MRTRVSRGVSRGHLTNPEVIVSPGMKPIKTRWHFIFRACFAGVQGLKTPVIPPGSRSQGGERGRDGGVKDGDGSLLQVRMKILFDTKHTGCTCILKVSSTTVSSALETPRRQGFAGLSGPLCMLHYL